MTTQLQPHPAAELFPLMQGQDFTDLVDDIRENGLREPVVLTPDGLLLDGRNRYRACLELGDDPPTRVEHSEPWAFVISANLHRRHLSVTQRAWIATQYEARNRGNPSGKSPEQTNGTKVPLPPSNDQLADQFDTSVGSIKRARQVREYGSPELQEAVQNDQIPITRAANIAYQYRDDHKAQNSEAFNPAPRLPDGHITNRHQAKRQYITQDVLGKAHAALGALDLLIAEATEGLDPAITDEEAAQWERDLSDAAKSITRLRKLLNERKGRQ